jgi:nucleotide-binding universal stress UspA family protein
LGAIPAPDPDGLNSGNSLFSTQDGTLVSLRVLAGASMGLVLLAVADGGPLTAQVVETALGVHRTVGGVLNAFHVRDPAVLAKPVMAGMETPAFAADPAGSAVERRAASAARVWAEHESRDPRVAFHDVGGHETALLVRKARISDLAIMPRPGHDPERPEPDYVKSLIFETGRPVMVVPPTTQANCLENVLVVWNRSAQAARALQAAIPLLKHAKTVTVASFGSDDRRAPTSGVVEYLAHHGVRANAIGVDPGAVTARGRGRAVVNYAWGMGAGLTVMGAYGEQGLFGFLGLGGATAKAITGTRTALLLAA